MCDLGEEEVPMSTHLKAVNLDRRTMTEPTSKNSMMFADRRSDYDRRKCLVPALMPSKGCRRGLNRRDRTTFTPNWWLHTKYVDWED